MYDFLNSYFFIFLPSDLNRQANFIFIPSYKAEKPLSGFVYIEYIECRLIPVDRLTHEC